MIELDIKLRAVVESDKDILLLWRNDEETCRCSLNDKPVDSADHERWFSNILDSKSVHAKIAILDEEFVGTIRLNTENNKAELSWTVAPNHRGRGVGKKILATMISHYQTRPLFAQIKNNNFASMQIAKSCGFRLMNEKSGVETWRLDS